MALEVARTPLTDGVVPRQHRMKLWTIAAQERKRGHVSTTSICRRSTMDIVMQRHSSSIKQGETKRLLEKID